MTGESVPDVGRMFHSFDGSSVLHTGIASCLIVSFFFVETT